MKLLYPTLNLNVFITSFIKTGIAVLLLVAAFSSVANAQTTQELVFDNQCFNLVLLVQMVLFIVFLL